jgi:hypothetical protein
LPAAFALQELRAELAFEFLDLRREGLRRYAEPLGGAGEMLRLGDRHEIAEQTGLDVAHASGSAEQTYDMS